MVLSFQALLPNVYTRLLPAEILALPIAETKATCEACIEVPRYAKDLKCCTFHPFLPNYLVGQILLDQKTQSNFVSEVLQHKISKHEYVLPLGVMAPVRYQVEFNQNRASGFGKREDWLCPYYDRARERCGIWRSRGSVCTTFYCQSSKGEKGQAFWKEALNYLSYVEMAITEETLVYLDFSPRQISDQLEFLNRKKGTKAELASDSLELKRARELWNGYFEDPKGFYIKTLEIAQSFDRKSLEETMGEIGEQLTDRLLRLGKIWTR
ncbi:MAG: hypothetical protein ACK5Y2_07290 [Bdellovibrionales bacterium]